MFKKLICMICGESKVITRLINGYVTCTNKSCIDEATNNEIREHVRIKATR